MEETLNDLFRKLIFRNECDNNPSVVYRFSDPDGVHSGKSGYSFGISQFDINNNDSAAQCLKECGFDSVLIQKIKDQTIDVGPLASRLKANAPVIDKWDTRQLSYCLNRALNFCTSRGVPLSDSAAILAVADYFNQYGSMGDGAEAYFDELGRPITAEDVLNFKLTHTKYGKEHPGDCQRRFDNLAKILPV